LKTAFNIRSASSGGIWLCHIVSLSCSAFWVPATIWANRLSGNSGCTVARERNCPNRSRPSTAVRCRETSSGEGSLVAIHLGLRRRKQSSFPSGEKSLPDLPTFRVPGRPNPPTCRVLTHLRRRAVALVSSLFASIHVHSFTCHEALIRVIRVIRGQILVAASLRWEILGHKNRWPGTSPHHQTSIATNSRAFAIVSGPNCPV